VRGTFNIELLANDAPLTVANFLNYVNRGAYVNSIIHRSVPGFVIQGVALRSREFRGCDSGGWPGAERIQDFKHPRHVGYGENVDRTEYGDEPVVHKSRDQ